MPVIKSTQQIARAGTGSRDMPRRRRAAGLPEPGLTVTAGFVITLRRPAPPAGQDKPTSRFQRYRLTEKGRAWLAARPKDPKA